MTQGERFLPHMGGDIKHEHLHRYALAAEFVKDRAVLDIASGEGYGAAVLAKLANSVVGVDIDKKTVRHATEQYRRLSNLSFCVGSCGAIPLTENSVDVVTSFETIEHHDKHLEMMDEIRRVLRPDGILIISSPNRPVYSEQFNYGNPFHVKELDYEELLLLLKRHFKFVQVYGQKLAAGSFVFPLSDDANDSYTSYASNGEQVNRKVYPLRSPTYFVAICSDVNVKSAQVLNSIYIDTHEELLQDTYNELKSLRAAYASDITDSSRMLQEIRSSLSFQFVRRVIWPVSRRLIPGLFRAKLKTALRKLKHRYSHRLPSGAEAGVEDHQRALRWSLDATLPQSLVIGKGNFLYLKGWCYHPSLNINELTVLVDDVPHAIVNHSMALPEVLRDQSPYDTTGRSLTSGFWTAILFEKITSTKQVRLTLRARLSNGQHIEEQLGLLKLLPFEDHKPTAEFGLNDFEDSDEPLVAICMTTYDPALDLFAQQINSLIAQTHRNWVCIISDDCSDLNTFREIQTIANGDPRFRVYRNANRLGFYRNFERCLNRVPVGAEFVAYCDQDDFWYSVKLAATLAAFRPGINLVYSDMDIVTRSGEVISHTYWTSRRNNFTDLGTMLFANTVTGASAVFRHDLLDDLLPFPELAGHPFHDHWTACVALAKGEISYVDKPLYAYRQHAGNVHGHPETSSARYRNEIRSLLYLIRLLLRGTTDFAEHVTHLRHVYFDLLVRPMLVARVLRMRLGDEQEKRGAVLERFARFEHSLWALAVEGLKNKIMRRPTIGIELVCLRAALGLLLLKRYCRGNRSYFHQQLIAAPQTEPGGFDVSAGIDFIPQKIAPLKLSISQSEPRRVNIILSEINFQRLFAGYFCVFNLALALKRNGYQVRLVLVDPCEYLPMKWKREIAEYEGLGDLFDEIETVYMFDRSLGLQVSASDAFLATSWWTAHIAHHASRDLNQEKFIYLIQDYEPLFYPAGSFYALAEQSYTLPHHAIISTRTLRNYFHVNRIGVFASNHHSEDFNPIVIRNAVNRFHLSEEDLRDRKRRRFLFYARPEQLYTARNLFELGVLALRETIREGYLDTQAWDFHGIGAVGKHRNVPLHGNVELTMLPNVTLREFVKLLPAYDLGMSLMLTPHPSLMPLDMAAAGLVTVTNTFATKTAETMSAISPNILAVPPTLDGLKMGLIAALGEVDNHEKRIAGSRLNWSKSWAETFGSDVMMQMKSILNDGQVQKAGQSLTEITMS